MVYFVTPIVTCGFPFDRPRVPKFFDAENEYINIVLNVNPVFLINESELQP